MAEENTEMKATGPPSPGGPSPRVSLTSDNAPGAGSPATTSSTGTSDPGSTTTATTTTTSTITSSPVPPTSGTSGIVPVVTTSTSSTGIGRSGVKSNANGPRSPKHARRSRIRISEQALETSTRDELAAKWREQDLYVECLEAQAAAQEGELACLRDSEEKYRQQCFEASHRERILVRRLASKEQQLLGYVNQITEMKSSQSPTASALRSALLDPAVNILIQKLRQELLSTKAKLEDTQNELSAWKFTPDSNTGKRLMAKCRLLYQENEELGRMIASGRIAKLEGELALQKTYSEEVKKSQSELDDFLQEIDEDVEGMQSTILLLQLELKKACESVSLLQQENNSLKLLLAPGPPQPSEPPSQPPPPPLPPPSTTPPPLPVDANLSNGLSVHKPLTIKKEEPTSDDDDDESTILQSREADAPPTDSLKMEQPSETTSAVETIEAPTRLPTRPDDDVDESSDESTTALIIKVENDEELSDRDDEDDAGDANRSQRLSRTKEKTSDSASVVGKSNGDERNSTKQMSARRVLRDRTTKRDLCATESDDDKRRSHKKKRRESVVSVDYNETEDDALVITNGESIQSDAEDGP